MNSGITSERVYDALKRQILDNAFRPGERLEPALLAGGVASSITPVREAFNTLTGEGLLEPRPGGGFHLPAIDQPGLSDLYAWNNDVLYLAIRGWPAGCAITLDMPKRDKAHLAVRLCFAALAGQSGNAEHARAIEQLSDRLSAARCVEQQILGDPAAELGAIAVAAARGDRMQLSRAVARYHRARIRQSASIVRALYRAH